MNFSRFAITSPYVFFTASAVILSYLLYTIIRRRRGERTDTRVREPEL